MLAVSTSNDHQQHVRAWLPWLAAAAGMVGTLGFASAYFTVQHYAAQRDAKLRSIERLQAETDRRLLAVPSLDTTQTYGPPYNVTITCTVQGSSESTDGRVPLDLNSGPRPGDVYVKTCTAN